MINPPLMQRKVSLGALPFALARGWQLFSRTRKVSVSFSMIFAFIGLIVLVAIEQAAVAPMVLSLAGGFMLVGPVLLCGFFALADSSLAGQEPGFRDIWRGFASVPRELLALALVCLLLFMIWITDAATLYGFMVGRVPTSLPEVLAPTQDVGSFLLWSSLMGAGLAFVIFVISAFSVPLLYYRRAGLVGAVVASVKAVFGNFAVCVLWALLLATSTILSILLLPVFLVTFPVLAFASHTLYREMFPQP